MGSLRLEGLGALAKQAAALFVEMEAQVAAAMRPHSRLARDHRELAEIHVRAAQHCEQFLAAHEVGVRERKLDQPRKPHRT